jgi:Glycosyl transferase family 2
VIWPWLLLVAVSATGFIFPYLGYPLWLRARRLRYAIGEASPPETWSDVSVIIAAFNAAERIGPKVREMLDHDYPGKLEIIVADDGSTDGTADRAEAAGAHRVLRLARKGKSEAQNQAVGVAAGPVLVFTDVTVEVRPGAIAHLVAELEQRGVGCVTGVDVSVAGNDTDAAAGAGLYTRFETYLRIREAQTQSLLGVNGCLFAVRKGDRPLVPPECVDDLFVPLAVCDRGLRVTLHPRAEAVVPRSKGFGQEYRRKVRTFAGGMFTALQARREMPRARRRMRWELFGHKWMRWAGPVFAAVGVYATIGLALRWWPGWLLVVAMGAAATGAGLGLMATAAGRTPHKLLRLPAFVLLVQLAVAHAWYRVLTHQPYTTWNPTRREM